MHDRRIKIEKKINKRYMRGQLDVVIFLFNLNLGFLKMKQNLVGPLQDSQDIEFLLAWRI
jgi:hypothetical protein